MNIQELGHNLIDMLQIGRQPKSEQESKNSVFAQLLACLTGSQGDSADELVSDLTKSKTDIAKEKHNVPSLPKADGKKASRAAINDAGNVKEDIKYSVSRAEYKDKKEVVVPERQNVVLSEQNDSDVVENNSLEIVSEVIVGDGINLVNPVNGIVFAENMADTASVQVSDVAFVDDVEVSVETAPDVVIAEASVAVSNDAVITAPSDIELEKTAEVDVRDIPEIDEKAQVLQSRKAEITADNVIADEIETNAEILPVVAEQEEKIAAMVQPSGKKLEISVNVEQDNVENTIAPEPVRNLNEVVNTDEPVIEHSIQNENKATDVELSVQPEPVAAVVDVPQAVLSTNVSVAEDNVRALETTTVSAVDMNALKSNMTVEKNNTSSLQNIYKGLTREVAEKIQVNITQSAIKGIDEIEIQLKPEALGKLDIKLHIGKDGKLQAHIIASNEQTLEVLRKDASILEDAFGKAGYQLDDNSLSFSYRGDSEHKESERERLRAFIGEVIEQDLAMENAANDYIGSDGVNIRV